ncbi:MAG TPA: DNA internalization-related competence protein ComEC/Rec2 [Candidatus Polarisedimenticolia bacterium]|nr:DNA internalization-related competence protein ComEC/Rec2 [Candidatus Polarisedimenticolia bacterium]
MRSRPLLWCSFSFLLGILLAPAESSAGAWGPLSAVLLGGGLALTAAARGKAALTLAALLVAAGYGACGALAARCAARPPAWSIAAQAALQPALFRDGVGLLGRVASPPRPLRSLPSGEEPAEELVVEVHRVVAGRRSRPAAGRVLLRVPPPPRGAPEAGRLRRGDRIRVFARVRLPRPGPAAPGSSLGGVEALGQVKSRRLLAASPAREGGPARRLMRRVDALRAELLRRLDVSFGPSPRARRAAAVSQALLLGERGGLGPEESRLLQESGLAHLLAVSGFNVAVLAWVVVAGMRAAGLPPRAACAAALPLLALYLLLNREESSVVRATIMAAVFLASRLGGVRADLLNLTGLAGLAILARSPGEAHSPGFQLSFAATLALLAIPAGGDPRASRLRRQARGLAAGTLAAMAATAPLAALHFNRVCPGALPANLLAGPIMSVAFLLVLGIEGLWAAAGPAAAAVAAQAAERCVTACFAVAEMVASIPGMTYRRVTPGWVLMAAYGLTLACALPRGRRSGAAPLARRWAWIAWGCCAAVLAAPLDTRRRPEGLRVTFLDVGQGDAVLLETPGGERLLVDAGGSPSGHHDAGERIVGPALWDRGVASIDRLILTHSDADHAGGAAAVAEGFRPKEIAGPSGWPAWRPAAGRLAARAPGARWRELVKGDRICLRGACVEVLHPPGRSAPPAARPNEQSLVLRVSSGGAAALLTGDAGSATERELEATLLPARLLKVGHHGSRTATSERLLAAAAPRLAVISCGQNNPFGHPHRETLQRLQAAGVRILSTDRHGEVEVELLPRHTRVRTARRPAAAPPIRRWGGG